MSSFLGVVSDLMVMSETVDVLIFSCGSNFLILLLHCGLLLGALLGGWRLGVGVFGFTNALLW